MLRRSTTSKTSRPGLARYVYVATLHCLVLTRLHVQNIDKPRALLLNQGKGIPLLWQTLGNKYKGQITFAVHRDRYGKSSLEMGLEKGPAKSSKVLYYPPGATDYVRYHGERRALRHISSPHQSMCSSVCL